MAVVLELLARAVLPAGVKGSQVDVPGVGGHHPPWQGRGPAGSRAPSQPCRGLCPLL